MKLPGPSLTAKRGEHSRWDAAFLLGDVAAEGVFIEVQRIVGRQQIGALSLEIKPDRRTISARALLARVAVAQVRIRTAGVQCSRMLVEHLVEEPQAASVFIAGSH